MNASRETILKTLRDALAAQPMSVAQPPARPAAVTVGADAWKRLAAVLEPLETRVRLASSPSEAARLVAAVAAERGAKSWLAWDEDVALFGLDEALADLTLVRQQPGRPCREVAHADMGVVLARAALLDSGSLVLAAGPGRSRSASLLPPVSVALVPKSALLPDVASLPGLLEGLRDVAGRLPACVNLVTGPSSTADIELVLVRGVHGPGALEIIGLDWD